MCAMRLAESPKSMQACAMLSLPMYTQRVRRVSMPCVLYVCPTLQAGRNPGVSQAPHQPACLVLFHAWR
eukprot:scaffold242622_cov24-Tisochrysis_lutea.AAC.1